MKQALRTGLLISTIIASPAMAADDAVLAQLKAMQAQISKLQGEVGSLKKELAVAKKRSVNEPSEGAKAQTLSTTAITAPQTAASTGNAAGSQSNSDVRVTLNPGPKFETADGQNSLKIGGFAQIDAGFFNDDRRDNPDGTNVRRARLSVSGTMAKDFRYKLENDFANNVSALTDVYLEYTGFKNVVLTAGQFKEPFGLETLTSDLFTSFMERAAPFAFAPDRNIGFMVSVNDKSQIGAWTASLGGFGSGTGIASTDDESRDLTGRLTLAPIAEKTEVLHFGVAGSRRVPDSATDTVRIQSRPETRLASAQTVDTGNITGVDHSDLLGLEAAAVWGPASLQGEYMNASLDRQSGLRNPSFDGYYVEASWFLTGESRNYVAAQGKFDRVKPASPFSLAEGTWGAWQLAARYSGLDLNDGPVRGGEVKDVTLGVRWYPQANLSFLANYIHVDTDAAATSPGDDPDIYMLRTQFDF